MLNEKFIIMCFICFVGLIAFAIGWVVLEHTEFDSYIGFCVTAFAFVVSSYSFISLLFGVPYSVQEESQTIRLSKPISSVDSYYSLSYGNNLAYVDNLGYIKI